MVVLRRNVVVLRRNVRRFRGELVFKAHRLFFHSTLDSRVIEKGEEKVVVVTDGKGDWQFVKILEYLELDDAGTPPPPPPDF